ncbi:MAG: hypothetical protein KDA44_06035 [Planctomycetales bacterium]|nr:hypothetical protein [Planctomycetales bacterium]
MSQLLKGLYPDAEEDDADDTTLEGAPIPGAMELHLRVTDRDVLAELAKHPAGAARDEFALEALKIGVLALRRASSQIDGDLVQREMKAMLDALRRQLDEHSRGAHDRLAGSLKEYFDPNEGRFTERVQRLTSDDGDLARVLKGALGGDDSQLARTLLAHVGENSPLMKLLSPDQSQGLLATLRTNVEGQLQQQRDRLLKEFSLDNKEGSLRRLVDELTSRHGDLSKDLQGKIDVVVKEFSLDEENSALSRLVQNVDRAQRIITNEFSLDNEQSALRRLKTELTTILEAHVKTNAEFQDEVKQSLTKLVTRREEQARGTQHGATFEAAVVEFVQHDAQRRGDVAEATGATTGLIKNCKIGDAVVELGPDCAAAGARIVIEAKEEGRYSLSKAREEIEQARKNRGAGQGVFVFSQQTAPAGLAPLARYGADVVVAWDAEDPATDAYLHAALEISRALCIREGQSAARETVDFEPIDRAVLDIEKRVSNLDQIRKSADTIKSSSETILDRVRIDQAALEKQVGVLRDAMTTVRRVLGETPVQQN